MPGVVLNTNILISAFFWEGNERKVLQRCRTGEYQSITSPEILEELEEVLRKKFQVPDEKINAFIRNFLISSELVFLRGNVSEIKEDPSDNAILETALMGGADLIITGDNHLLRMKSFKGITIKRAGEV
ncbi:MAG: putative toxin-antitoxin system toxin component, PIN family [Thermoplasmata archaeon]|nr:putative toxin-antitoxin system toxin component, PIN family [Thermoplasmata archaeon]